MKKMTLTSILIGSVFSTAAFAVPSCNERGYDARSVNKVVTGDWLDVIMAEQSSTITDGNITGIDAVAYKLGLKSWNEAYKTDWCDNYADALYSAPIAIGQPYPVPNTIFNCQWVNEPSSASDPTTIFNVKYCMSRVERF